MTTFARSIIASDLAVSRLELSAAVARANMAPRSVHQDSEARRATRCLLEGAALAGAQVKLAFYKADWTLRYMLCLPCPGVDATARYVTVVDLELSEQAERTVYRRVCLDTIAGASIDYRAGAQH